MRPTRASALVLSFTALVVTGCGSGMSATRFTNPGFDFGFVERVAVVPFENLTDDRQAAARATRLVITELLSSGAIDVVEPGEVQAALDKMGSRITTPSTEQVVALGQSLGVQGVIIGAVAQSETLRTGTVAVPVVTLDLHLLETETGVAVWAATHTEKGGGLGSKLFGVPGEPMSETTRKAVRRLVTTLVQ